MERAALAGSLLLKLTSSVAPSATTIGAASAVLPRAPLRSAPILNTPFETRSGCASSPPVALNVNVPDPVLTIDPAPPSLPAPFSVTSPSAEIATSLASTSAGRLIVAASATVTFA